MEGALKKRTVSVLVLLFFFFCETGFVFAQNSAMFEVTAPSSAQAGKEINFAIEIINAGREIWEGERYYTFVRIYDRQKKELTGKPTI